MICFFRGFIDQQNQKKIDGFCPDCIKAL